MLIVRSWALRSGMLRCLKTVARPIDRIRGKSICDTYMLALLFPLPLVKQIVYLLGKGVLFTFSKTLIVCASGAA